MARTPAGLTDDQVAELRAALLVNKRPKVTVAGQQFGGETTGQVVTVGEPQTEGPEFIQVRVTLDGLTDVLRFAPKELRLPQRGRAPGAGAPKTARAPRRAAAPKPSPALSGGAEKPGSTPETPAPTPVSPAPAPSTMPASAGTSALAETSAAIGQRAPAPPTARSRRVAARPPAVTITLSSSGTDWTMTAHRGGKSVVKAAAITPGVVAAAVELLGEQAVSAAVDEVNGAALDLAQQRAAELRAELAAVESLLAAHRTPGRRPG